MKLNLFDISYGKDFVFNMEDKDMGGDLSVMFGYLETYKKELKELAVTQVEDYAKQIVWKARIAEIERFQTKYNQLIEFANFIEGEENGL